MPRIDGIGNPGPASTASVGSIRANAAGIVATGDTMLVDNNGITGGNLTAVGAPQGLLIRPQGVFGDDSQTAAALVLAGGEDEVYFSVDSYALAQVGDTLTINVFNSNGARVINTFTVVAAAPGANQFVAATSNTVTAANIVAAINAAAIGVTAVASVGFPGSVLFKYSSTVSSVITASSRSAFTSAASGQLGPVIIDAFGLEFTNNGQAAYTAAFVPRGTAGILGLTLTRLGTTTGEMQANKFSVLTTMGNSESASLSIADGLVYGPTAGLGMLTAGTMTGNTKAYGRTTWTKFAWTNAMVTALGAVTTGNVAICTLPAKTLVKRCIVVIGTAETALTSLTVSVGRTAAGYIDFLTASNAKAAANTVYGDTQAEIGADLKGTAGVGLMDALPSYTTTTVVNAQFVSGVENLSTAVASTGIVYLETELLP